MFVQFLKAACKRVVHQKLYSAISVFSLTVGLVAVILIYAFVRYESSFDTMHPQAERTYRLNWVDERSGARFATFYNTLSPVLDEGLAEIESVTRLARREHLFTVAGADQVATLTLVDATFFSFFAYPAVHGDPAAAIADVGSAVITESAARRFFGTTDALGLVFTVDDAHDFRVAAVVADNPANSHLGANVFANIDNLPAVWNAPDIWENPTSDLMYHYVRLAADADPAVTAQTALRYLTRNLGIQDSEFDLLLQPLRDVHFTPDLQNEMPVVDDILGTVKSLRQRSDLAIFGAVALLTLGIAALNFMNMRALQFSRQAREIGVRRVAGSSRTALVLHLLGETALLAMLALAVALPLCELLLPYFSAALGAALPATSVLSFENIAVMSLLTLVLGLAAGLFPALGAARMPPATALRGEFVTGSAAQMRSVLIVLQFTISICLISAGFVVKQQLDFAYDKPLGFDPVNVVRVALPNATARRAFPGLSTELAVVPGISAVSGGTTIPTGDLSDGIRLTPDGGSPEDDLILRLVGIRENYFSVLGMNFVAGRALSEGFGTDVVPLLTPETTRVEGGVVLNESAARLAGWRDPKQALGKRYYYTRGNARTDLTVVGVVADAHYGSIRREVEPVAYAYFRGFSPNLMTIRLDGRDNDAALAALERAWRERVPDYPISYGFLDDTWHALYAGETRTFALFIALSTLAILIACSGLYGLAAWITERRTKEIGVRKVLGGSVWSIVLLLTNDFSKLVLLANLFAWPIAWFAMDRWLENFAYRVDLTPMVFIGSGLIALCIAWVTVGGTAAKAASAKPVLALRYE